MPDIIEIKESTNEIVMARIDPGKQYLTSAKPQLQKPQKGPTCWFYAYNAIRIRIGKEFVKEYNELVTQLKEIKKTDPKKAIHYYNNILVPLKMFSKNERVVSAYRKMLTHCSKLESGRMRLCKSGDINPKTFVHMNAGALKSEVEQALYAYLHEFQNQEVITSFKEFVSEKIAEIQIAAAIEFYQKLGKDSRVTQIEDSKNVLTLKQMQARCHAMVRFDSASLLGLNRSRWNTSQDIDHLITTIQKEGAIVVSAQEGPAYYAANASKKAKTARGIPYKVYSLPLSKRKDEKTITQMDHHAVLVVGAEKGTHKNNGLDFVYIMDPNDASIPKQMQKVYKIPFEQFKASILKGYNYCADEWGKDLVTGYRNMKDDLKQLTIKSNREILKNLALGIGLWTLGGALIAALLVTKAVLFSFIALPVLMIAGACATIKLLLNKHSKPLPPNSEAPPALKPTSTAIISEKAQFVPEKRVGELESAQDITMKKDAIKSHQTSKVIDTERDTPSLQQDPIDQAARPSL